VTLIVELLPRETAGGYFKCFARKSMLRVHASADASFW
jgi:hypothetical protein